jgi:hypothetical protein
MLAFMAPKEMMIASIGSSVIGLASAYVGVYYFSLQGAIASMLVHAIAYFLLMANLSLKYDRDVNRMKVIHE